jgi:hypothetical protein
LRRGQQFAWRCSSEVAIDIINAKVEVATTTASLHSVATVIVIAAILSTDFSIIRFSIFLKNEGSLCEMFVSLRVKQLIEYGNMDARRVNICIDCICVAYLVELFVEYALIALR